MCAESQPAQPAGDRLPEEPDTRAGLIVTRRVDGYDEAESWGAQEHQEGQGRQAEAAILRPTGDRKAYRRSEPYRAGVTGRVPAGERHCQAENVVVTQLENGTYIGVKPIPPGNPGVDEASP